jgi:hypothetical protein
VDKNYEAVSWALKAPLDIPRAPRKQVFQAKWLFVVLASYVDGGGRGAVALAPLLAELGCGKPRSTRWLARWLAVLQRCGAVTVTTFATRGASELRFRLPGYAERARVAP